VAAIRVAGVRGDPCGAVQRTVPYWESMACPALPYFSTLSHRRHDFRRKKKKRFRLQNVCFDYLYNFFLKHFSF